MTTPAKVVNLQDSLFVKRLNATQYDLFQGTGWDNWTRVEVSWKDGKAQISYVKDKDGREQRTVPLTKANFFRFQSYLTNGNK